MIYSQGCVIVNTGECSSKTTAASGQLMDYTVFYCALSACFNVF